MMKLGPVTSHSTPTIPVLFMRQPGGSNGRHTVSKAVAKAPDFGSPPTAAIHGMKSPKIKDYRKALWALLVLPFRH